ncbi:hypothetical protein K439DRAFT_484830 [Ramaria rubella]|nr:hypothetical protein K439DRAFT_484830 [Ramaria rubella]
MFSAIHSAVQGCRLPWASSPNLIFILVVEGLLFCNRCQSGWMWLRSKHTHVHMYWHGCDFKESRMTL